MKDIVYTRKYMDQKGLERKEYITVGYLFEKEGRTSILMKPYINVSALTNEKGEVWLGVYEHKKKTVDAAKTENTQANQTDLLHVTEPTVDEISKVVNEGKSYAEKWKELAEGGNDIVCDDAPF